MSRKNPPDIGHVLFTYFTREEREAIAFDTRNGFSKFAAMRRMIAIGYLVKIGYFKCVHGWGTGPLPYSECK